MDGKVYMEADQQIGLILLHVVHSTNYNETCHFTNLIIYNNFGCKQIHFCKSEINKSDRSLIITVYSRIPKLSNSNKVL